MLYKIFAFSACFFGAMAQQSIVGTAAATADLSTLVAVLSDPNYKPVLDALSGPGPFTVFAPTNEAFSRAGVTLEYARQNVAAVTDILTYHVVGAQALSTDLMAGSNFFDSLQGTALRVNVASGVVEVNAMAKVVAADVLCTNGVVHVVDAVIMPIPQTIVENALATDVLSTLVTVLTAPAYRPVLQALTGDGPFTVFAPTDDAFAAAGLDVAFVTNPDNVALVTDVLKYHVISGAQAYAGDLAATQTIATLNGKKLTIEAKRAKGVTVNGDTAVIVADVQSSNGVVHVIDKVLMPPAENTIRPSTDFSVVGRVAASPKLATLNTVLRLPENAPLLDLLSGPGPFTIFAPTSEAFQAADVGDVPLYEVLAYHVVLDNVFLGGLMAADETSYASANGADLTVTQTSAAKKKKKRKRMPKLSVAQYKVNEANVVKSIQTSNGFVHIIDKVLLPPTLPSIVEAAIATPALSTLVAVLTMPQFASVLELLAGPGPFTVFAPTSEAFSYLDIDLNDVDAVAAVLAYHVVSGAVKAGSLAPAQQVPTLGQGSLDIVRTASGMVTVNNAHVTTADVVCSNGVVHVVDRVLLPPSSSKALASSNAVKTLSQVQAEIAKAIEIGVPQYNSGDELGCYQTYARAVFGVVITSSPGASTLDSALSRALDTSMAAGDKAWILRTAMDEVMRIAAPAPHASAVATGSTSFSMDVASTQWQTVDDRVMGGISQSRITRMGDTITFAGYVTTDSNGGFSTAQTNFQRPVNMNSCRGISLMAKASESSRFGIELGNGVSRMSPSFEADFYPSTEWSRVEIPFSSFNQQTFGSNSRQPLNKASIASFGLRKSAFLRGSLQKDPAFTSGQFSLSIKDVGCLV